MITTILSLACAALFCGLIFLMALFASNARRERAQWRICLSCQTFHNHAGQFSFSAPLGPGRYRVEECQDCRNAAVTLSRSMSVSCLIALLLFALPVVAAANGEKTVRGTQNHRTSGDRHFDFLDRIAEIESRHNCAAVGKAGEAGSWQLTEAAWADVNSLRRAELLPEFPFVFAHDDDTAREYALQYLGLLSRKLSASLHRHPTEAELYASYAHGFDGFKRRGFSLRKCSKSTRVAIGRITR